MTEDITMTNAQRGGKEPLVILTGPTAVGKSDLAVKLAQRIGGEIISADSMQVYRGMDIGSAKITPREMQGIPHYLIDVLDPQESFDITVFQHLAKDAVKQIRSHGNIPIIAGGTGFYIQSLLYDIHFTDNGNEPAGSDIRSRLERVAKEPDGPIRLYDRLKAIDPASAEQIHANNVKRIIRAIEYYEQTGEPISVHNEREKHRTSPYHFLYFVLTDDRQAVYDRIDRRVDRMIQQGLVLEVQALKNRGCTRSMVSMQGLGYKEILDHLDGKCTLEEAVYIIKRDTRHFAKRQLTWFRREKSVEWLDRQQFENDEQILEHIQSRLREEQIGDRL